MYDIIGGIIRRTALRYRNVCLDTPEKVAKWSKIDGREYKLGHTVRVPYLPKFKVLD